MWATSRSNPPAKLFHDFQKTKALSFGLLEKVQVAEICVGVHSDEFVKETVDWAIRQYQRNQDDCPTGVISLDVEEVKILASDYQRIIDNSKSASGKRIKITRRFKKGDQFKQFPVKVMIGDGYTWGLMVSLVVEPTSKDYFEADCFTFQPSLLQYLKDLPVVVGVGIEAELTVVPDKIEYDMILGVDFLRKHRVKLNLLHRMLSIRRKDDSIAHIYLD